MEYLPDNISQINSVNKCPPIILAVKRSPKIIGRKKVLINSIRAITGPIGKKRSFGVWCFKNLCGLVANHEKTAAPHKEKLTQKIIFGKV